MSDTLVPSNGTRLQHDLARLAQQDANNIDVDVIRRSRDPWQCHPQWLPWLAWENSISAAEGWDFADTGQTRRDLVAGYIALHQHKGTPSVIRQLFKDLGLGEIDIIERVADLYWDGTASFNGHYFFGGMTDDWAKYGIVCRRVITNRQAEALKKILDEIAPLRCELVYIDYREADLYWNGEIYFDGTYNFGAV